MNKCLFNLLKYIGIFLITVLVLFLLLILTAKIPKEKITDNLKESLQFFKDNRGIEMLSSRREYRYIHYYADSILLNIIYGIDSDNTVKSVLEAKYYETIRADVNNDFIKVVEQDLEPNQEYLRYWHGSMAILRPLLVFFNMEQIYLMNKVALWGLAAALLILLFFKSKKVAIIYVISMVLIAFQYVPMCFEYSWTFYIMFIASIIAIICDKRSRGNSWLYKLFFVTGIVTCYLDFLTTEIITVLVPLLLVIYIRKEENRITGFKETFKFICISCVLWFCGYGLMWFAKWIIASLVLGINAMEYVKDNLLLRINGLQGMPNHKILYEYVISENFYTLYPINILKKKTVTTVMYVVLGILLLVFDWKNIKKKWFALLTFLISLAPYVRYLILANHSYRHSFFTFRSQIITIIGLGIVIIECLNYKLLLKKVKLKNIKNVVSVWRKNGKSRTNDTNTMSR